MELQSGVEQFAFKDGMAHKKHIQCVIKTCVVGNLPQSSD